MSAFHLSGRSADGSPSTHYAHAQAVRNSRKPAAFTILITLFRWFKRRSGHGQEYENEKHAPEPIRLGIVRKPSSTRAMLLLRLGKSALGARKELFRRHAGTPEPGHQGSVVMELPVIGSGEVDALTTAMGPLVGVRKITMRYRIEALAGRASWRSRCRTSQPRYRLFPTSRGTTGVGGC
jgi:hypothetical protein